MGEYVKLGGDSVKLGTCEDLYYTRFDQLRQRVNGMAKQDGNLEPREYLKPGAGWRFRFPFPDEDGIGLGEFEDYDRGLLLPFGVSPDDPIAQEPDGHNTVVASISVGGIGGSGSYNVSLVNAPLPCPASGKLDPCCPVGSWPVEIVQQKLMEDGELWTVLRCGWCGSAYRIAAEEAEWLAEKLYREGPAFWFEVASRIRAGYQSG